MKTSQNIPARHCSVRLLFMAILLAVPLSASAAGGTTTANVPLPPTGFILDEARTLPDDAQSALSGEMMKFHQATGCKLWLVTTTYVSDNGTLRDRSLGLSRAWNAADHGIVLAYDRASDSHVVSPSDSIWQVYPTPSLIEAFREAGAIIQDKNQPLDLRLISGTRMLMKRLTEAEQQRQMHNQLLPGRDHGAAIVFLALLVAAALGSALILAAIRKRDADQAIRYFFPQADGALRFGAPYGGGVIAELSIGQKAI